MNRLLSITVIYLFSIPTLYAQEKKTQKFEMTMPAQKITNSLYNRIVFLDQRIDTNKMGIVTIQSIAMRERVIPKTPLYSQMANLMNALTDSTAKNTALIFQLMRFTMSEVSQSFSEIGYCYMRANIYSNAGGQYKKIRSIDTVVIEKAGDVTKVLLKTAQKIIPDFIAANLLKESADSVIYSFNEVVHMDSIDKRKIKLYNTDQYAEGIYDTYASFRNQVPDRKITVEMKKEKISYVMSEDEYKQLTKLKPKDMYAIVYKNQPYIASESGYIPLQKVNDEFIFISKGNTSFSTTGAIVGGLLFGMLGGVAGGFLGSESEASFEIKIDFVSGALLRVREVKVK